MYQRRLTTVWTGAREASFVCFGQCGSRARSSQPLDGLPLQTSACSDLLSDESMNTYLRRTATILIVLIVASAIFLYVTRSKSVVLRIPPDDTIRPRYHCLLNPFRDKTPEELAELILNKLRDGQVEAISPYIGESKIFLEKESQWPVESWRVGNREDKTDKTEIMYWVKRGNGYFREGYEEEVMFEVGWTEGSWKVKSFSAIY